MANFDVGDVSEFHYSSVGTSGPGEHIVTQLGTANSTTRKALRITDLKATTGAGARTIQILGRGASTNEQKLDFDIPANSYVDFHWELPYLLSVQSTTGATVGIVASTSGAGIKYSISGYFE